MVVYLVEKLVCAKVENLVASRVVQSAASKGTWPVELSVDSMVSCVADKWVALKAA